MSEMQDTIQILAITSQVGEKSIVYGFRLLKFLSLSSAKMINTLYLGKWKGDTSFKRFRAIKGEDMQFMCIHTEDQKILRNLYKEMKNHGILVGKLPDLCIGDGMVQFVFSPTDAKKMEAFLINHSNGKHKDVKIETISESIYQKTSLNDKGEPTPQAQELEKSITKNKDNKLLPVSSDAMKSLSNFHDYSHIKESNCKKVTIDHKDSVVFQHSKLTAYSLPSSDYAVLIPKKYMSTVNKNGTINLYLNPSENYTIVNKHTHELSVKTGDDILQKFDKISLKEKKKNLEKVIKNMEESPKRQVDTNVITSISINEKLFAFDHTDLNSTYLTRIPYKKTYVEFDQKDCKWKNDSKDCMLVNLKDSKIYNLFDSDGNSLGKVSGKNLKQNYNRKQITKNINL